MHFRLEKSFVIRVHRQKREQKAAHPRAMLSFKIAEFAKFYDMKAIHGCCRKFQQKNCLVKPFFVVS